MNKVTALNTKSITELVQWHRRSGRSNQVFTNVNGLDFLPARAADTTTTELNRRHNQYKHFPATHLNYLSYVVVVLTHITTRPGTGQSTCTSHCFLRPAHLRNLSKLFLGNFLNIRHLFTSDIVHIYPIDIRKNKNKSLV